MSTNDLERRALLGDRQAQEECTRLGVLLPCWRCGGKAAVKRLNTCGKPVFAVSCEKHYCGAYGCAHPTAQKAIKYWNTRSAPPIGYCRECRHWTPEQRNGGKTGMCVRYQNGYEFSQRTAVGFYCGDFKPKEAPND